MEEWEKMKTRLLPKRFIGKGEVKNKVFERVKTSKYMYIYRIGPLTEPGFYFEVVVRRINTRYNIETYPSSYGFGKYGFTYPTEEDAITKFKELNIKAKKKKL